MKVLLLYPEFPDTFWSFRHALPFIGKRSAYPPLGLLTVSALLPPHWKRKLVDLNVEKLRDKDLAWADRPLPEGGIADGGGRTGNERRQPIVRGRGPRRPRRSGRDHRSAGLRS
jgi:hypothetical protein